MNDDLALKPLLKRYPDARRGFTPLLEPVLLPYLGLIFGSLVASLFAVYNAVMLKRFGLALRSILVGTLGWISFQFVVALVVHFFDNVSVGVIVGRFVHFALGGALYAMHRPHFRGHEFLNGRPVPLLASYVLAILISMKMPWQITARLLGAWNVE
jgi:ABC-type multidrug transport system fused ATPase/permease subunit